MSTITTIAGSDVISTSRTTINTNFSNLNTDKIETSTLDTDTTLAANSDAKIATQKAVKAYVDAGGNVNASTTARGIVEEATSAEIIAGTGAGGTGARLFINPTAVAETGTDKVVKTKSTGLLDSTIIPNNQTYSVGALDATRVKTYFNMQLPFTLWTGSTSGALTTDFVNWERSSTDADTSALGTLVNFTGTGADTIILDFWKSLLLFSAGNIVILDFWAQLPASGTGDISMGFGVNTANAFNLAYNASSGGSANRVMFTQSAAGALYATISKDGTGVTNTDISSGLTLTNWNNYRIELDLSNNALFYVNGTLKATLSGANLYTAGSAIICGFGRSNTSLFKVTAPNLSLQMNP